LFAKWFAQSELAWEVSDNNSVGRPQFDCETNRERDGYNPRTLPPWLANMFKQNILGLLTLFIAVIGLGLAVIPGIALDRPVQLMPKPEPPPPPLPETETKGGLTLRNRSKSRWLKRAKLKTKASK
jgi:hypothetical protein